MDEKLAVVIMAAGKGTRMNNPSKAKVMYRIGEKPLLGYVVGLAQQLQSAKTVVIVGWQKETVVDYLRTDLPGVEWADQAPQLGTAHAVMQAEEYLKEFEGDVLVLSGDVPLLRLETLEDLIAEHRSTGAAVTVLTAVLDDAGGYGRILRNDKEDVIGIVEERDATDEQRKISEINSGIYVFDKQKLFEGLRHITPQNVQKEYYLTDILAYWWNKGGKVRAAVVENPLETRGINTIEQLDEARDAIEGL